MHLDSIEMQSNRSVCFCVRNWDEVVASKSTMSRRSPEALVTCGQFRRLLSHAGFSFSHSSDPVGDSNVKTDSQDVSATDVSKEAARYIPHRADSRSGTDDRQNCKHNIRTTRTHSKPSRRKSATSSRSRKSTSECNFPFLHSKLCYEALHRHWTFEPLVYEGISAHPLANKPSLTAHSPTFASRIPQASASCRCLREGRHVLKIPASVLCAPVSRRSPRKAHAMKSHDSGYTLRREIWLTRV